MSSAPTPLEICIEDLDSPPGAPEFVRCVALPGGQPGLGVSAKGALLWKSDESAACELWVSMDDRLMLLRPENASAVMVRRAGRSLEAPYEKPVVLLDQDLVEAGGKRMRVHFHGVAHVISPPTLVQGLARAAVTAALGGAVLFAGGAAGQPLTVARSPESGAVDAGNPAKAPIEVLEHPPKMAAPKNPKPEPKVKPKKATAK